MDIDRFFKTLETIYKTEGPFAYTLEGYRAVFRYFFSGYEEKTGEKHPPIKREQTRKIMEAMPTIDAQGIAPDEYPEIIDKYFDTPFKRCDYRINHFFSGDVRTMRINELL